MAYLDVMAGSGLNLIREGGHRVGGSAVLAALVPRRKFDYIVAIEKDPKRAAALKARLATIRSPSSFEVVAAEADAVIDRVLADLERRKAHFLAFIDYQGVKGFSSTSMEHLLQAPCDVWFTYFPNAKRVYAKDKDDCRDLFGDLVDEATDYDNLLNLWDESLLEYRGIKYRFPIDSGKGYFYHLIFLTRETRHGSPYTRAADDLGRRLDAVKGNFAKIVLDILSGQQKEIDPEVWEKQGA